MQVATQHGKSLCSAKEHTQFSTAPTQTRCEQRASQSRVRGAGWGKAGGVAEAPLKVPPTTQPHGDARSPSKRPQPYKTLTQTRREKRASQSRVRGAGRGKTGGVAGAPLKLPPSTQPHEDPAPQAPNDLCRAPHTGTHLERLGTALGKGAWNGHVTFTASTCMAEQHAVRRKFGAYRGSIIQRQPLRFCGVATRDYRSLFRSRTHTHMQRAWSSCRKS